MSINYIEKPAKLPLTICDLPNQSATLHIYPRGLFGDFEVNFLKILFDYYFEPLASILLKNQTYHLFITHKQSDFLQILEDVEFSYRHSYL